MKKYNAIYVAKSRTTKRCEKTDANVSNFYVLVFHWKQGQEQPQAAQTFPSGARQIYPIHPKGLV